MTASEALKFFTPYQRIQRQNSWLYEYWCLLYMA